MAAKTDIAAETTATADFFFDPLCPWAWMTSRWMTEVEKVRDVQARWRVMSLAVLNDRETTDPSWGPVRVIIAAAQAHGDEVIKPLYDAIGTRFHPEGRRKTEPIRDILAEALVEVGLPADLVDAAEVTDYDDAVRASHEAGISLVGTDVGTPIVSFDGVAFFGPVVTPAPKGEAAGLLWDGCLLVARTPGFYELKRTRTQGPIFD